MAPAGPPLRMGTMTIAAWAAMPDKRPFAGRLGTGDQPARPGLVLAGGLPVACIGCGRHVLGTRRVHAVPAAWQRQGRNVTSHGSGRAAAVRFRR